MCVLLPTVSGCCGKYYSPPPQFFFSFVCVCVCARAHVKLTKISGKFMYAFFWFLEIEQHYDLTVFQQKSDLIISALQCNLISYLN